MNTEYVRHLFGWRPPLTAGLPWEVSQTGKSPRTELPAAIDAARCLRVIYLPPPLPRRSGTCFVVSRAEVGGLLAREKSETLDTQTRTEGQHQPGQLVAVPKNLVEHKQHGA